MILNLFLFKNQSCSLPQNLQTIFLILYCLTSTNCFFTRVIVFHSIPFHSIAFIRFDSIPLLLYCFTLHA